MGRHTVLAVKGFTEVEGSSDSPLNHSKHSIMFSGNELVIHQDDGRIDRMNLPHPIIAAEDAPNGSWLFVVTDPPSDAVNAPNLYCIDWQNASVVWTKAADKSRSRNNIFTQSRFDPETNTLTVWDWDGYKSVVNPANGQLIESHFFK